MVTKLQVLVREVYEQEEKEMKWNNIETGENIDSYDYKNLDSDEERAKFVRKEISTGKMELLTTDNDPIYGQLFHENDLDVKELILHLNRTK